MTAKPTSDNMKYMRLLAEKYPSERAVTREIINLTAILNLPKGTEHFMSDLHGEYEAFCHILNNCSGVIREKLRMLYGESLGSAELNDLCTLIYYPAEKLRLNHSEQRISREWYRLTLERMIELARVLSSKYTRSKVRKAMPADYAYIIDELLHAQKDEDDNQVRYHAAILDAVISINADDFMISLSGLIKRLAVDRLHIVGDVYDRGDSADRILDLLMRHHSVDIQWGNHDILWMGAACGSEACIAAVVRNSIAYRSIRTLERGYGISLRKLYTFARELYPDKKPMDAALQAITVMMFKLEGQLIRRNPDAELLEIRLLARPDPRKGARLILRVLHIFQLVRVIKPPGDLHVILVGQLFNVHADLTVIHGDRGDIPAVRDREELVRIDRVRLTVLIQPERRVPDLRADQQPCRKTQQLVLFKAQPLNLLPPLRRQQFCGRCNLCIFNSTEFDIFYLHH